VARVPHVVQFALPSMTTNVTSNYASIFQNGRLKPGIYKIQNIYTDTYLDIEVHSMTMCCHPARDLGEGRGLWEIKHLGVGCTVQRVDPGNPEQFCTPLNGLKDGTTLCVSVYPTAWRVGVVGDEKYRGFGYVRFFWATKMIAWDLEAGRSHSGAEVRTYENRPTPWQIWRLIPVKDEGTPTPSRSSSGIAGQEFPPSYEGNAIGESSAHTQRAESQRDEFGTIVTEVTTVTTRRRYRVEDA